ncbi:MAG: hypothetical protein NTV06_09670 [candidate division Zixibacteria bacterium]|nr:hypothetical protein [candidate division Zixibacteria bacterium]
MIRPVELLDALSKAEVAGKLSQIQKAHSEMEQRQVATAVKEKTTIAAERTHETEKSDSVIINKDKQEQEKEEKRKNQGQDEDSKKTPEDEDVIPPPEHLDLKA